MNKNLINQFVFWGTCSIVCGTMINSVKASQQCFLVDANQKVVNLGFMCGSTNSANTTAKNQQPVTISSPPDGNIFSTSPSGNTNATPMGNVNNQPSPTNSTQPSGTQRRIPLIRTN